VVPFVVPAVLTALVAFALSGWPRDIAPGSGLKFAGLVATAITSVSAWRMSVRGVGDVRARRMAAVLCGMVGLMGWPLWSAGVLPALNGVVLQNGATVWMALQQTEATPMRRSRDFHHWAVLVPVDGVGLTGGLYYISEATYDRLGRDSRKRSRWTPPWAFWARWWRRRSGRAALGTDLHGTPI
jgi:hypothetical protein